jgi:hypothetical protein
MLHHPVPTLNPGHLQQIYSDDGQSPGSMYFRQQQQRLIATEIAARKYDHLRNM